MPPQEKTKDLIKRFENGLTVKDCALIAVNLLMEEADGHYDYDGFIAYWDQVKQEIEKL